MLLTSSVLSATSKQCFELTSSVLSATSKQCFELTSSVLSTTSKQCFEQPAAGFLVCSLIFIEYKIKNRTSSSLVLSICFYPITLPFATAGSTVRRVNCPSCSAERIIPWLTYFFIILRGLRLATICTFLPTNSCSFG